MVSAPNKNFDPVLPAALEQENLDAAVTAALQAIAAAQDLGELKQARIEHSGDRSPLALANREIGALPPSAKAGAGKAIGAARGRVNQALKAREAELKEAERERILTSERVEVSAHVRYGEQSRALAARFEERQQRWCCTALEFA